MSELESLLDQMRGLTDRIEKLNAKEIDAANDETAEFVANEIIADSCICLDRVGYIQVLGEYGEHYPTKQFSLGDAIDTEMSSGILTSTKELAESWADFFEESAQRIREWAKTAHFDGEAVFITDESDDPSSTASPDNPPVP